MTLLNEKEQKVLELGCKEYIKYIKSSPCCICGSLDTDAHHMDFIGMGGNRKKPSLKDFSCVSLCREHHTEYHSLGHKKFTEKYNRDLWKEVYYNMRGWFCE